MLTTTVSLLSLLAASAFGCTDHSSRASSLEKRQYSSVSWAYDAPHSWGKLSTSYLTCQTGTQQSPISLSNASGLSTRHIPTFNYANGVTGTFYNWGYGPAFTVTTPNNRYTNNPSFKFGDRTVYLKGWHIHAPAEHIVNNARSRAELHLVHVNAEGREAAVLAFRINPGTANSTWFAQLGQMIDFNETGVSRNLTMDFTAALSAVGNFREFWTYQGSLTSPPCTEGIRWFVARPVMTLSIPQMQSLLGVSAFSTRVEQEVWQHRINE